MNTSRRHLLLALAATPAALLAAHAQANPFKLPDVHVWKSPTCGCCTDWITHLHQNGFRTRLHDTGNEAMRKRLGIPQELGSCHTALVGGYALEGHVPARDVRRLLAEKPQAIGLTVPGMPVGSPGMDGPEYGQRRDAYAVLLVLKNGSTQVFQKYPGA